VSKNPTGQLLSEIRRLLGAGLPPSLTSASAASDLYEAYLFTRVVRAAIVEGASVSYENVDGSRPSHFTFRTSPGHIHSTAHAYTHAVIVFPNQPVLEAHVGVRVAGKSRVLHECDVALIRQTEAESCRQWRTDPRSSQLELAIEAKYYVSSDLELGLGRAFIGLKADLSAQLACFVTNSTSTSIMRLLTARNCDWQDEVLPQTPGAVRLEGLLHNFFHRYKAR
jgi:hypothetical protein